LAEFREISEIVGQTVEADLGLAVLDHAGTAPGEGFREFVKLEFPYLLQGMTVSLWLTALPRIHPDRSVVDLLHAETRRGKRPLSEPEKLFGSYLETCLFLHLTGRSPVDPQTLQITVFNAACNNFIVEEPGRTVHSSLRRVIPAQVDRGADSTAQADPDLLVLSYVIEENCNSVRERALQDVKEVGRGKATARVPMAQPDPPHADKGRTIRGPLFSHYLDFLELIRTDHVTPPRGIPVRQWKQFCRLSSVPTT
jgi:hypothetical protein